VVAHCWSICKLLTSWELDFCDVAALASYFLFNSKKKVTKEMPPRLTQAFILKSKIKVPASLVIYLAAAELTN